jgi:hypothetical protein
LGKNFAELESNNKKQSMAENPPTKYSNKNFLHSVLLTSCYKMLRFFGQKLCRREKEEGAALTAPFQSALSHQVLRGTLRFTGFPLPVDLTI